MTVGDDTAEHALASLLGLVLREIASGPRLLDGLVPGGTRSRIGRVSTGGQARGVPFESLLVDVFDEIRDALIGYTVKELRSHDEAEDVVQTAFMRIYARKPDINEPQRLQAYAWRVVKNLVNDEVRRTVTDRHHLDSGSPEHVGLLCEQAGLRVDDLVSLRDVLLSALESLSPREREAVVLRGYGDYSLAEVAKIMGVALGTAKSYAHHGFARLRAHLETRQ
ncbi:RNA polymerase sigma factor [Kibdelosporangium phytohabitans]|uniref:RNA polymerase subunit sigma-24 n=1 Tax=Kibdelosporangium phytohabitans TaxID=860235 RepID=A0A0N9I1M7_9PSEU|nr:RNA polymerase sigma factor [Kibdelosporangium phytohabitans]ALG08336.1 hypothetical protein AOZ06_16730 [Kibdelosporangium phytohabitans]MBE1470631.1 RNA polymerase sigma-70 factor (ECF subfamily) [Kibdelosporangium phytohabitans]